MDIVRVTPDDTATVDQLVGLSEAIVKVDCPWEHPFTRTRLTGMLRYGWDGEPPEQYAGVLEGHVIGSARLWTSDYDNLDLAWFDLGVHPDHRRRGHGTALLAAVTERARELGRSSTGIGGWESAATRGFAEGAGFTFGQEEVARRLDVDDVPDGFAELVDRARRDHAGAYEFLTMSGPVPQELLAQMTDLQAAINDAPWDDIDMEPEVFPIERLLGYEQAQAASGRRLHRVIARHSATGELVGHTIVAVSGERPDYGDQQDTTVVREHRGHRLGIVLKGLMLDYLRRVEPQCRSFDTWNAASNDHMIAVNEAMGFHVTGRSLAYQRKG
ncbi:GNAT family N-acetyltransferase [Ornithinimicrobium cryptoxanthini]|uniref:GNAT family N-acetyltransferase n=1 Tax=Ornithinimicrobium cryptoxanthini TaxID=2934161 RepID=UPI002118D952|nr:GNAT family N-acetyltransferase [Ornithinimicrobium cryptoxanthini]